MSTAGIVTPRLTSIYLSRLFGALGFQVFSMFATLKAFSLSPKISTMGFLGLSTFASVAAFSLLSGSLIDRLRAKGLYAVGLHGVLLLLSAVSVWSSSKSLYALYCLVFLIGSIRVMRSPIYFVLANQLMAQRSAANGVGVAESIAPRLFVISWQLAAVIGPLAGGAAAWYFGLDSLKIMALVFFIFAFALLLPVVGLRSTPKARNHVSAKRFGGLGDAVQFFIENRVIRETFVIDTVGVLFAGVSAFLPFLLVHANLSPNYLGLFKSLQSAGALATALCISRTLLDRHTGKIFVTAVCLFALLTMAVPLATSFPALAMTFTALGLLDGVSILIRDLLLFKNADISMQGRIYALNSIFISSSDDLGELESGFTGQLIGIPASAIAGGAVCIAVTIYFVASSKELWRFQLNSSHIANEKEVAA